MIIKSYHGCTRPPTGTPPSACCNTAVICSTEKRFFFTAFLAGPQALIVPQISRCAWSEKPEPLTGVTASPIFVGL
jgi:hypothetical protein